MPAKTQPEIDAEVVALRALKPCGRFAENTQETIDAVVEELEDGWDITTEEFEALTEGRRELIEMAREWKLGQREERPSEGWEGLVG